MGTVFKHTDANGDWIKVFTFENLLRVVVLDGRDAIVDLDRGAAMRLHNALGEHLYPTGVPVAPDSSAIAQMIEAAVKNQIATVLPLHLSTVATVQPESVRVRDMACDAFLEPGVRLFDMCPSCGFVWANHQTAEEPESVRDPEPKEAGHPEEPEPQHGRLMAELPRRSFPPRHPSRCPSCDHAWADHTSEICWGPSGSLSKDTEYCQCRAVRP
jgi:hypothetical protein